MTPYQKLAMGNAKVIDTLGRRFESGNEIPVDSARITRDEWFTLLRGIAVLQAALDSCELELQDALDENE